MGEGVDAVHGAGDPDDDHGDEEEEGDARVQPRARVGRLLDGFLARDVADVEDLGGAGGTFGGRRAFDVHDVWVVLVELGGGGVGVVVGWAGAGVAVEFLVEVICVAVLLGGGGGDVFDCDVDGGGNGAGEGVFVEGVEEAFELVTAAVDDEAGAYVDYEGEDDGGPGWGSGVLTARGGL